MKKGRRILGLLGGLGLIFSMQLTCFAQADAKMTEKSAEGIGAVLLQQEEKENAEAYAKIHDALLAYEETIDLTEYRLTENEVMILYHQVVNENSDLFYVGDNAFCDYNFEEDENWDDWEDLPVTRLWPLYGIAKEELEEARPAFQAAMDKALAGIDESMTDVEKALYLHDYIIENCQFAWDAYQYGYMEEVYFTAYSCLVNGETSTSGYVFAYSYLLKEVGIESQFVNGFSHTWNAVKLNGKYYYVDLHCDNPIKHAYGRGCCYDYVGHMCFLLGEEEMMSAETGLSHAWAHDTGIQISSGSYGWFPFKKVSSPMCYYKGNWYYWTYLDEGMKSAAIMKTSSLDDMGVPIHSLDGFRWYTMDTEKVWKGYNGNIGISPERGKLYYCNSRQILSLDLEDLSAPPKLVMNVYATGGYIYGLKVVGDSLVYGISENPNYEEYWIEFPIDASWELDLMTGDIDGDGIITSDDALMVLKRAIQLQVPDFEEFLADYDEDGIITSDDALSILKKAIGL